MSLHTRRVRLSGLRGPAREVSLSDGGSRWSEPSFSTFWFFFCCSTFKHRSVSFQACLCFQKERKSPDRRWPSVSDIRSAPWEALRKNWTTHSTLAKMTSARLFSNLVQIINESSDEKRKENEEVLQVSPVADEVVFVFVFVLFACVTRNRKSVCENTAHPHVFVSVICRSQNLSNNFVCLLHWKSWKWWEGGGGGSHCPLFCTSDKMSFNLRWARKSLLKNIPQTHFVGFQRKFLSWSKRKPCTAFYTYQHVTTYD